MWSAMPKPTPWPIAPGESPPGWEWFWATDDVGETPLPFLVPWWWGGAPAEHDLFHQFVPTISGTRPTYTATPYGHGLRTNANGMVRYQVGNTAEFRWTEDWTLFLGIIHHTLSGDQRTCVAKGPFTPTSSAERQLILRTTNADPAGLEVKRATITIISASASINTDVPYQICVTNDASEASNATLYTTDLMTGAFVHDGVTGSHAANVGADQQFGGHYSLTNDPADATYLYFYYVPGLVAAREQIVQLALDPFGPLRQRKVFAYAVPAAGGGPVGPPFMHAMAGVGR